MTRAIKGMSDRAPGPDGRTLNGLKELRREEVAAHFNLWLLAGYPPTPPPPGDCSNCQRGRRTNPGEALSDYHLGHNPKVLPQSAGVPVRNISAMESTPKKPLCGVME